MYPVESHQNDIVKFLRQNTHECHVRIKIINFVAWFLRVRELGSAVVSALDCDSGVPGFDPRWRCH